MFLCLYPPYCACHILMETSTSAAGRMHLYALWFIRVRTRSFICRITFPSFLLPAIPLCVYAPLLIHNPCSSFAFVHCASTFTYLAVTSEPPSCMPSWSYALHGLFIRTPGHFTHERTPWFASTTQRRPRHVTMHARQTRSRECLCWCAWGGRG